MLRPFPLVLALLLFTMPFAMQAQKTAKKTTTSKTVTKKKKAVAKSAPEQVAEVLESPLLDMGGDKTMYMGQNGDKLIYEVQANGLTYDFIVTIKQPASDDYRYAFDWEMTAPMNKTGHVDITKKAALDGKKYKNYFEGGKLILTDASTVWMTAKNFADMPAKETTMQFDYNQPETFYRKDEAETAYTIKYKGKDVTLDIFKVDNDKQGGEHRQVWIQGISSFALIVKMDLGWTIRLKEIQ